MKNKSQATVKRILIGFVGYWIGCFPLLGSAQTLEAKSLLRQGMQECRAAKALRRSNLQEAQVKYDNYLDLLDQAVEKDGSILNSNDPTARRVLNFCENVKIDLDRAVALPIFDQGLVACGEARVLLSTANFDDAKSKYEQFLKAKDRALAITDSVLSVYESSYELRLCNQLEKDIVAAIEDRKNQLKEISAGQVKITNVVNTYNEALGQCRGAQSIINDKQRYTNQTPKQVELLLAGARSTLGQAKQARASLAGDGLTLQGKNLERVNKLAKEFDECEAVIPDGIALITRTLETQAKLAAAGKVPGAKPGQKPGVGGKATPAKTGVNSDYKQIVGSPAAYPRRAVKRNIEGHVLVSYTITKSGDVADIKVLKAEPTGYFENSVTKAVSKYKYQPRIVNGQPVDTKDVQKKLTFKLQ